MLAIGATGGGAAAASAAGGSSQLSSSFNGSSSLLRCVSPPEVVTVIEDNFDYVCGSEPRPGDPGSQNRSTPNGNGQSTGSNGTAWDTMSVSSFSSLGAASTASTTTANTTALSAQMNLSDSTSNLSNLSSLDNIPDLTVFDGVRFLGYFELQSRPNQLLAAASHAAIRLFQQPVPPARSNIQIGTYVWIE
jgi:hypothetical protein